jgi:hypothetical protein
VQRKLANEIGARGTLNLIADPKIEDFGALIDRVR